MNTKYQYFHLNWMFYYEPFQRRKYTHFDYISTKMMKISLNPGYFKLYPTYSKMTFLAVFVHFTQEMF